MALTPALSDVLSTLANAERLEEENGLFMEEAYRGAEEGEETAEEEFEGEEGEEDELELELVVAVAADDELALVAAVAEDDAVEAPAEEPALVKGEEP